MFWQWLEQILVSTYMNNRFDRLMTMSSRTDWWLAAVDCVGKWIEVLSSRPMTCSIEEQSLMISDRSCMMTWQWAALMVSKWLTVLTSRLQRQVIVDVTVGFDCKCKLVLLLRLGYLKPFLAGSKKTRQGPRCRAGALCISRCWFFLTVVAEPN